MKTLITSIVPILIAEKKKFFIEEFAIFNSEDEVIFFYTAQFKTINETKETFKLYRKLLQYKSATQGTMIRITIAGKPG